VQWLWAARGDQKQYPNGRPLSDFMLPFGDARCVLIPPVMQTVAYQEMVIDSWIFGSNSVLAAKGIH
jgi:hypothetical protein